MPSIPSFIPYPSNSLYPRFPAVAIPSVETSRCVSPPPPGPPHCPSMPTPRSLRPPTAPSYSFSPLPLPLQVLLFLSPPFPPLFSLLLLPFLSPSLSPLLLQILLFASFPILSFLSPLLLLTALFPPPSLLTLSHSPISLLPVLILIFPSASADPRFPPSSLPLLFPLFPPPLSPSPPPPPSSLPLSTTVIKTKSIWSGRGSHFDGAGSIIVYFDPLCLRCYCDSDSAGLANGRVNRPVRWWWA